MRTQNKNNNKILKFSIRKLSFGAAPVVIGALFFGSHAPSDALANEGSTNVKYTYLAENELTESEKSLIKKSIPENIKNNETYYMVYKKETQTTKPTEIKELPNTGQSSLPVAGLGIGTAVLVVLLMSKKHRNKVLSVVLIGAMGQSVIMPFQTFAFENKELVQHNTQTTVTNSTELANGIININGYRYVGYFTNSDLSSLPKPEQKVLPKLEQPTQPVKPTPEQPTIKPTQPKTPKIEVKTTPEEGIKSVVENKPELKSTTEVVPFKTIEQPDATLPKGQTKVVQDGINGEQIVFSEVTTVDGKATSKVIKTSITKQPVQKVIAVGTKEETNKIPFEEEKLNLTAQRPGVIVSKEVVPFETVEQPDAALPKGQTKILQEGVNGERTILTETTTVDGKQSSKVIENVITKQPVNKVIAVGTKEDTTFAPQPVAPEETKPTQPSETKPEEKVDKTALKAQIDRALALVPADYSTASYNALKPILESAQNVYASETAKQPEIDSETTKLKAAIDALTVDKTYLNKTIVDAKSKTKEHYSDATWVNLQTVLADAEKVTNNPTAKQSGVDHINEKLKAAIAGLNTDKTELEKQLADANSKVSTDFSPKTWSALEEAKRAAQEVEDNATATQTQIDEAAKNLKAAIAALNVVKTELQEQIKDAATKQETDYSQKSWNDFKQAEIKAKEINDKTTPLPKQSEIDAATKALQDAIKALAVDKTALQNAINTANSKRKEEYTTQTWKVLEESLATANTVNADGATTQSKVNAATEKLEEAIKNLAPLAKKPVLFVNTDKKVLDKEVVAEYTLDNPTKAKIKSITATLKKDGQVVKTVNLTEDNLKALLENVEYFKEYTLSTTMIYDRGNGQEETETLTDQPIQLDLKKVEIKNIKETSLISVNDAGVETDISLLSEKPADVAPLYLRVITHDNKVTRLAIDKIEEIVKDGKTLYKVTATAPDLIQRNAKNKLNETYTHYFEKQKAKEGNVYYNFNELVKDMQANPTGEFKLGADLTAANVPTPSKSYVTAIFKGKLSSVDGQHYSIHNIARPLFARVENAHIHDINLANVDINMPWANKTAPLGEMFKKSTIENIKVTGNVVGNNDVTGMVNKLDESNMRNVAFIGNITSVGTAGWWSGGLVSESWRSNTDNSYIDAYIKGNKAKVGGLVAKLNHGDNPMDVSAWGRLKNSVAKGTIDVKEPLETGGLLHSNWSWGLAENNVTMMKVKNGGEILYGSRDAEDDDYFGANWVRNNNVFVNGVSEGKQSYSRSSRWKGVSEDEANARIAKMGITAHEYAINEPVVNTLNNIKPKADTYKDTQDYKAERELAYRNIEKLQPFYNKEWIINQGNKIPADSKLLTTEVLSVTGMKNGQFVTDLSDVDKIMIHYADGTKEEKAVTQKESQVQQVREYSITGLDGIVYTPNMVVKDRAQLINDIKEKLDTITLESSEVRAITGNVGALYLEESFAEVKGNLDKLVKALIENEDHQLNGDEAAIKALLKKVEDNKAKIMMALTYINRYYGVEYGDLNIKNIMMFKPDFYGKTPSVIDRLIRIGSQEKNLKGDRTQDAYREIIAGDTGKGDLRSFLDYNMRLFTDDTDLNDWFIHSAKNVYVVEPETTNPDFKNKRHRVFDGLNNNMHARMILPLLNLKKAHIFMISTYNTMAYSSFEKYGKNTEAEREAFKERINYVAKAQQTYLDFWSRLALPNVRDRLLKSQNMVPTPVWDNQAYAGIKDANRRGYGTDGKVATPIRELFGPTDRWHQINWNMGAMAKVYANPYEDEQVFFMVTNMLEDFGISAFTHETTHVNDRMAYLGGHGHRQGTDLEAYAQGMLQTPDKSTYNGEYGALGINMAYHRQNDGNQWYNPDPDKLQTREQIDHYMKNYNDALMMLDHLEADAVLPQLNGNTSRWFKKMDRQYRSGNSGHQFDKIRELTEDEKKVAINTIDDLITNNLMTKHGAPGDGTYNPTDFSSAYVNMNMMTGIYGGNTSQGAPGAASFKHNTFRMWGYFGYENGFVGYASSKYQGAANKENNKLLGDDFIIKKVSNNRFSTLEEWKKAYYQEVKAKADKGFTAIEIDGKQITNYAELKVLFDKAVEADLAGGGTAKTVELKSKVFKALLKNTDGFSGKLFKD